MIEMTPNTHWLDKYIKEQICNREAVEKFLDWDLVCEIGEYPEEAVEFCIESWENLKNEKHISG